MKSCTKEQEQGDVRCGYSDRSSPQSGVGKNEVSCNHLECEAWMVPVEEDDVPSSDWDIWKSVMQKCEEAYLELVDSSRTPQEARDVLPNSLKTEVVMTANIREWRAFFRLRAACETGMPHPQMLEVSIPLFQKFVYLLPELFFDIEIPDEVMLKYGFSQKD